MRLRITMALALLLGCATTRPRTNVETALFLANAQNGDDTVLVTTIDSVLNDMEEGTYKYDDEARKYVFDAIRRTG
jgi:hypothetical protein